MSITFLKGQNGGLNQVFKDSVYRFYNVVMAGLISCTGDSRFLLIN